MLPLFFLPDRLCCSLRTPLLTFNLRDVFFFALAAFPFNLAMEARLILGGFLCFSFRSFLMVDEDGVFALFDSGVVSMI
jgi:hypothetical protein